MDMEVYFPGGKKVYADFGGFTVETDQPIPAGEGTAPNPFELFLASIGTCAGIFALGFMQQRGIDPSEARIKLRTHPDPADPAHIAKIDLELQTPPDFPEKYLPAIIKSMDLCKVKKHLADPPEFDVTAV
ncbi:MAG: OsmC family protein [Coriobacteriia bacterium]|nr:OsmC family protein [Coriobacteriia bacterium]